MINPDEAIQAFKEKFSKMSYDEREQYLKKMGFSFGTESTNKKKNALVARRFYREVVTEIPTIRLSAREQLKKKALEKVIVAGIKVKK